jgi:hypothetical protein
MLDHLGLSRSRVLWTPPSKIAGTFLFARPRLRSRNQHREAALFRQSTSGISRAVSGVWHAESLLALARDAALLRTGVPDLRLWRPRTPRIHFSFQVIVQRCCRPQHLYLLSGMQWVAKLGKLVNEQFSGAGPSGRQTKARAKIQRKPHI